jgi:hypothetical protein
MNLWFVLHIALIQKFYDKIYDADSINDEFRSRLRFA